MKDKTNEELLNEFEKTMALLGLMTEKNRYEDIDRLQGKVDRIKEEILSRMN